MSNPDGVLDAIDACLEDYELSPDAMRWAPEEPGPTPQSVPLGGQLARFVEESTGLAVMDWQRHYLNVLTPAVEAGTLTWDSDLTPPREAIFDAISAELETPSRDGLLRITMPDASETCHRVVSVTPGETPGEFVLTLEPATEDAMGRVPDEPDPAPEGSYAPGGVAWSGDALRWAATLSPAREVFVTAGEYTLALERAATALSEFAGEVQSAVQAAAGAFGKAFAPFVATTRAALHRAAHEGDHVHRRRCPTCNPYGFPKPLPINGHEYHRRQRRRNRR